MYFRQLLNDETACASYLLGCKTHSAFAVVDPHIDLVDEYVRLTEAQSAAIVAVFETHVQADHVSGLPQLVARTGATAYLPEGSGVASHTTRSATAKRSRSGTPRSKRRPRPAMLWRTTSMWSPITPAATTRGSS